MIEPKHFFPDDKPPRDFHFNFAKQLIKDCNKLGLIQKWDSLEYPRNKETISKIITVYGSTSKQCIDHKIARICALISDFDKKHDIHFRKYNDISVLKPFSDVFYTRLTPEMIVKLMLRCDSGFGVSLAKYVTLKLFDDKCANDFIEHIILMERTDGIPFCGEINIVVADAVYEMYKVCNEQKLENKEEKLEAV